MDVLQIIGALWNCQHYERKGKNDEHYSRSKDTQDTRQQSIIHNHGYIFLTFYFMLEYSWFTEHIKKQRHFFANKGPSSQSYGFSSSHVWTWKLEYKESWAPRIDAFELWYWRRLLTVPWTARRSITPTVNPKGNHSWIFIGKTDAEAEAPVLWPPDEKNWLIGKDPDAGKDWRREKKGTTEDEMVGWHHWLNGHGFEQALGVGVGQRGLVCCSPWGHKESDRSKWLNWTE